MKKRVKISQEKFNQGTVFQGQKAGDVYSQVTDHIWRQLLNKPEKAEVAAKKEKETRVTRSSPSLGELVFKAEGILFAPLRTLHSSKKGAAKAVKATKKGAKAAKEALGPLPKPEILSRETALKNFIENALREHFPANISWEAWNTIAEKTISTLREEGVITDLMHVLSLPNLREARQKGGDGNLLDRTYDALISNDQGIAREVAIGHTLDDMFDEINRRRRHATHSDVKNVGRIKNSTTTQEGIQAKEQYRTYLAGVADESRIQGNTPNERIANMLYAHEELEDGAYRLCWKQVPGKASLAWGDAPVPGLEDASEGRSRAESDELDESFEGSIAENIGEDLEDNVFEKIGVAMLSTDGEKVFRNAVNRLDSQIGKPNRHLGIRRGPKGFNGLSEGAMNEAIVHTGDNLKTGIVDAANAILVMVKGKDKPPLIRLGRNKEYFEPIGCGGEDGRGEGKSWVADTENSRTKLNVVIDLLNQYFSAMKVTENEQSHLNNDPSFREQVASFIGKGRKLKNDAYNKTIVRSMVGDPKLIQTVNEAVGTVALRNNSDTCTSNDPLLEGERIRANRQASHSSGMGGSSTDGGLTLTERLSQATTNEEYFAIFNEADRREQQQERRATRMRGGGSAYLG